MSATELSIEPTAIEQYDSLFYSVPPKDRYGAGSMEITTHQYGYSPARTSRLSASNRRFTTIQRVLSNEGLRKTVRYTSESRDIPMKHLYPRLLLHLPKFTPKQLEDTNCVQKELQRIVREIVPAYRYDKGWVSEDHSEENLESYELKTDIKRRRANSLIENYHYIGVTRPDLKPLAFRHQPTGQLVALVTLSEFDLDYVPIDPYKPSEVMVISRILSLGKLPKNSLSFLLGLVFDFIRKEHPRVGLLLTYLNPNVRFTGALYKATNWQLHAREWDTRYNYISSSYATDRQLRWKYGTAKKKQLKEKRVSEVSFSKIPLMPLEILSLTLGTDRREVARCEVTKEGNR